MIKFERKTDVTIYFNDGSYIETEGIIDCCAYNYADLTSLDDTGFYEAEFKEIIIDEWDYGFRINGYAVNCYSSQNGYYSVCTEVRYKDKKGKIIKSLVTGGELIYDCYDDDYYED